MDIAEYCREIETYLCRKNDGHLIRVVGPSFELVSGWAERGVPLKVACEGIDRYFERYYRSGPRRRPVKIDFCDADVLDVFDEWRRAVGITHAAAATDDGPDEAPSSRRGPSLPEHLERVVTRLSSARASGALGPEFDPIVDAVAGELDEARRSSRGVRGDARQAMLARLASLDASMLTSARRTLDAAAQQTLEREADGELAPFRTAMTADAYTQAREAAIARLVRERLKLPTIGMT